MEIKKIAINSWLVRFKKLFVNLTFGLNVDKLELPEIVVGLLQVNAEPWKSIYEQGQLQTWIKNCPKNIKIINIYGQTPNKIVRFFDYAHEKLRWSPLLQGPIHILDRRLNNFLRKKSNPKWKIEEKYGVRNLIVDTPSTILTLPIVELTFFKYFLNETSANYLYMSNTSSYINLESLNKISGKFPKEKLYGGVFGVFSDINFASGSNRILSRDMVEVLVNNFTEWDFSYVEDVTMGKILEGKYKNILEIPSLIFKSETEIDQFDFNLIKNTIHFRLKSGNLNSRIDQNLMKHLHGKLTQS